MKRKIERNLDDVSNDKSRTSALLLTEGHSGQALTEGQVNDFIRKWNLAMVERIKFTLFPEPAIIGKSNELPKDIFKYCTERWPQFKNAGKAGFTVDVERDSDVLEEIIEFIKAKTGKDANWSRFPAVYDDYTKYQLEGVRQFDEEDIEGADYYWCIPQKEIAKSGYRHDDGTLEVERGSIMAQPIGAAIDGFTVICIDSIRQEIENQNFLNVEFKPVTVIGKKPPKEPLWELVGKMSLPPIANKLVNDQGATPDESARGCWVEDLFYPPILTYKSDDLAQTIESFDIAHTAEKWHSGIIVRRSPFLICSKRFKVWCEDRKLKFDWIPVHVKGINDEH